MSFTAYVSQQAKDNRYAHYCGLVNKKKVEAITIDKTAAKYGNVDKSNPLFNTLHQLNSKTPERLNELPPWVRRNLGDSEAIDVDDDIDSTDVNVRSAVGMLVRGQFKQLENGAQVGHRRTAMSTYNERTGEPFKLTQLTSVIHPTADQKVNCTAMCLLCLTLNIAQTRREFFAERCSNFVAINQT